MYIYIYVVYHYNIYIYAYMYTRSIASCLLDPWDRALVAIRRPQVPSHLAMAGLPSTTGMLPCRARMLQPTGADGSCYAEGRMGLSCGKALPPKNSVCLEHAPDVAKFAQKARVDRNGFAGNVSGLIVPMDPQKGALEPLVASTCKTKMNERERERESERKRDKEAASESRCGGQKPIPIGRTFGGAVLCHWVLRGRAV